MIEAINLTKRYGIHCALDCCTFHADHGEIVGLLGPNGAGKTTLLRMLLGFLRPSSGRARIAGYDCQNESVQVREHVGYVPGNVRLMGRFRVQDYLALLAGLRRPNRRQEALACAERLQLPLRSRIAYLSTGMRQKLALCAVLSADVPVMILDEPTANLDPSVRHEILKMVLQAKSEGRTILFSSHVLSEVEEISDRVIFLRQGQLVHTQSMIELRKGHRIRACANGIEWQIPAELQADVVLHREPRGWVEITAQGPLSPILQWIAPLPLSEIYVEPLGLRDVYEHYFPTS